MEAGIEQDQAAQSLGANAVQRFRRITLPTIKWALAYGVVLSLARSLGEFGAVRVVSGSVGGQTQTVTLLVDERAEQFGPGAYQLSVMLIAVAALFIVIISLAPPAREEVGDAMGIQVRGITKQFGDFVALDDVEPRRPAAAG